MGSLIATFSLSSLLILLLLINIPCNNAQLSATFYSTTCPNVQTLVRTAVRQAISSDRRMGASLIRLHFHDCFVQGCDASILLDETPTIQTEKTAFPNANSIRGENVVEAAKRELERACPGVVSCADILTLAARDASVLVGGSSWEVRLGRRDSTTANHARANSDLPPPTATLRELIGSFGNKGLNARDLVALSGAHTLGQSHCQFFRGRIYSNGTDIEAGFASTRRRQCPPNNGNGDGNLAPLDLVTPNSFDNNYYRNLMQRRGLLQSDQALFNGGETDSIVTEYSRNPQTFLSDFASAMVKMSEIEPLLGVEGIIRRTCGAIN